jgi:hypothetical protein
LPFLVTAVEQMAGITPNLASLASKSEAGLVPDPTVFGEELRVRESSGEATEYCSQCGQKSQHLPAKAETLLAFCLPPDAHRAGCIPPVTVHDFVHPVSAFEQVSTLVLLPFVAQVGKNCQPLVGEVVIEIVDARRLPRHETGTINHVRMPFQKSNRVGDPRRIVFQIGVLHGDDTVSPSVAAL